MESHGKRVAATNSSIVKIALMTVGLLAAPSLSTGWAQSERPAVSPVSKSKVSSSPSTERETSAESTAETDQQDDEPKHPLETVLRIAKRSELAAAKLTDYEASFAKREFVNGRRDLHKMQIKFRTKPFSVYMKFSAPSPGREVIYVEGKNNGNLLAHETGIRSIVGTVSLNPTGSTAMSEGRYPITYFGMQKMVAGMVAQWENELKHDENTQTQVKYFPKAKLGDRQCLAIEVTQPRNHDWVRFHITRLYIDRETNLPVRLEQFGFPRRRGEQPPLIEEYTYTNIKTDVGLSDIDFDPNNRAYGF